MVFEAKEITLKNGQLCTLKSPTQEDAEAMLLSFRKTCGETDFMGRYADEITMTVKDEQEFLEAAVNDPKRMMIVAFIGDELIGSIGFYGIEPFCRYTHRAGFGMSIYNEFWNLGVGSALLNALIESARLAGYEQLELEVVTENERAVALYKKLGFEIYGTRENTLKYRDGSYKAAYLMIKKL